MMKKVSLFFVLGAVVMLSLTACGESEAEKQARLQAYQDSLRAVEQAKVAAMMEQMKQDSIAASQQEIEEVAEQPSSKLVEAGPYVVQVGAWRSEEKAQKFVDSWAGRGYPSSYVVKIGEEESGDVWFRVRVGFFETKDAAEAFGADLASEINTGYWVSYVK